LGIENFRYLNFAEAVFFHIDRMRAVGEIRYGIDHKELLESALARPQQAAVYENADIIRQAATLYFGLIKNHPWLGGNKRTATVLVDAFLILNGFEIQSDLNETIKLVLAIESDEFKVDEIENWLREKTFPIESK
jgi:death on curing protein